MIYKRLRATEDIVALYCERIGMQGFGLPSECDAGVVEAFKGAKTQIPMGFGEKITETEGVEPIGVSVCQ